MCTVTYLPTGSHSFLLTTNRDESSARPATPPSVRESKGVQLLYPSDSFAGGTWVCLSDQNRVACLMNGAFEKHEWNPPYRKSRGLVLLDLFHYPKTDDFFNNYDLHGIEPFTIVLCDRGKLCEFRWDGTDRHIKNLPANEPAIWSSASLYPKDIRDKRERWFAEWLKERKQFGQKEILDFHQHGGDGDKENDVVMNRYNMVQTVSITSINKNDQSAEMLYMDLIGNHTTKTKLEFSRQSQELESH